eukprot:13518641-Heterocapsa_arctica.AAC.1
MVGSSAFRKVSATLVREVQNRWALQAEEILRTAVFSVTQMRKKLRCTAKDAPLGVRTRGSKETMLCSERKRRSGLAA